MKQPSAITMMAIFLRDELQNRGVFSIDGGECEKIMAKVLERSSEAARWIERLDENST